MENQQNKKYQILAELDEETDREKLVQTMEHLDQYTVDGPSAESTEALIAFLKPILPKEPFTVPDDTKATLTFQEETNIGETSVCKKAPISGLHRLTILQLIQPQAMLISKWFVLGSILLLIIGLGITKAVNGNMLRFLTNAAPILGVFSVFYEFRAKLSGTLELENACPYSAAQLATARLLVVLGYDTLLCLAATPFVSYYQGQILWQVMISWFAPLLLTLGIALTVSLWFGIPGGCLVAATIWFLQLVAGNKGPMAAILLPKQMIIFADLISIGIGSLLLLYTYLQWKSNFELSQDVPND